MRGQLDCNTPLGREYTAQQGICAQRVAASFQMDYAETDKHVSADIDILLSKDHQLKAIAEIKCRNMSLDNLQEYGSYLITMEKLSKGMRLSKALMVPFLLFVYLLKDNRIVYWKITGSDGEPLCRMDVLNTKTQATCNGGVTFRTNAYLPVSFMKHLPL